MVALVVVVGPRCAEEPLPPPAAGPFTPPAPASTQPLQVVVFSTRGSDTHFTVEVVDTDEARSRGLTFRESLPEDRGMLFVFPDESVHSFWMKDTKIALDMIFVDSVGRVVGVIEAAQPMTTSPRNVGRPSRYVVEIAAMMARKHGIGRGTTIRFERLTR